MYISNSEIRARAREALDNSIFGGRWLKMVLIIFIMSLILGAANYLACGIGTLLLTGPLYVGLHKAQLKAIRTDDDISLDTAFEGCHDFGSNLVLGVMHSLIIALWSLLFIIPGIIKSYSYALVYYIKADHPEYSWRECLNESEELMRGHKMDLFLLHLSFIGWALLSMLTCGIGSIWVNAYQMTSTAVFYDELKSQKAYY